MGYCAEPTPEMGEFSIETRGESFYLRGPDCYDYAIGETDECSDLAWYRYDAAYNAVSGRDNVGGTIEIPYEAIPFIRKALDQAEAIYAGKDRPGDNRPRCETCDRWLGEGDHTHPPADFSTVMFPAVPELVDV